MPLYKVPSKESIYWPRMVTMPQHLWPFCQTWDYSDHGSVGGINLTPQGSGNSFGQNGLILNGSGWAESPSPCSDLQDVGGTYSVIIDVYYTNPYIFLGATDNSTSGWYIFTTGNNAKVATRNLDGVSHQIDQTPMTSYSTWYQIIAILTGGTQYLYVNGVSNDPKSIVTPNATTGAFCIGALDGGAYILTGTIKRCAVLKGHAWTPEEIKEIYSWSQSYKSKQLYAVGDYYFVPAAAPPPTGGKSIFGYDSIFHAGGIIQT